MHQPPLNERQHLLAATTTMSTPKAGTIAQHLEFELETHNLEAHALTGRDSLNYFNFNFAWILVFFVPAFYYNVYVSSLGRYVLGICTNWQQPISSTVADEDNDVHGLIASLSSVSTLLTVFAFGKRNVIIFPPDLTSVVWAVMVYWASILLTSICLKGVAPLTIVVVYISGTVAVWIAIALVMMVVSIWAICDGVWRHQPGIIPTELQYIGRKPRRNRRTLSHGNHQGLGASPTSPRGFGLAASFISFFVYHFIVVDVGQRLSRSSSPPKIPSYMSTLHIARIAGISAMFSVVTWPTVLSIAKGSGWRLRKAAGITLTFVFLGPGIVSSALERVFSDGATSGSMVSIYTMGSLIVAPFTALLLVFFSLPWAGHYHGLRH
ncbi:hypothetical protein DL96DRAFT_500881 [Flagelloscypha sp. PMI_526]|nr:hypothetical protein DL96DRAFT_500881 [Flagelloscypha sp. PMI_526]